MNFKALYALTLLAFSVALAHGQSRNDYLSVSQREAQFSTILATFFISIKTLISGKGVFSDSPNASADATQFVKEIAKDHGIQDCFDVKIGSGYAAGTGTIFLEKDPKAYFNCTTLDKSLHTYNYGLTSDSRSIAEQEILEHIGSLDHEFTHFKNHDMQNALIFSALLNFGLIGGYLAFESTVLAPRLKNATDSVKSGYAVFSGIALSTVSTLIDTWTRRLREKRADEGVRNDPAVLKAMIDWTIREQTNIKELLNSCSSDFWLTVGSYIDKYPCLYLLLDSVHPPLPERQARFEQRLKEIESA